MGIDYSAEINVGYRFTEKELREAFGRKVGKNKFRKENRFDPKTGKKVGVEKVQVEWARTVFSWDGIEFDANTSEDGGDEEGIESFSDFIGAIAHKARFKWSACADTTSDEDGDAYVFVPFDHPESADDGVEVGRFDGGGSFAFKDIAKMGDSLAVLADQLMTMGLKPGEPRVFLCASAF